MLPPLTNARVPVYNGDLSKALKNLKKTLAASGTPWAIRRHEAHTKPGEARRMKSLRARKRIRRSIAKAAEREAARSARGER